MAWTVHLEGGPRRVNHAAVTVGHKVYSFGGYCTGENFQDYRPVDVQVLHTVNYRWTVLPTVTSEDEERCLAPFQRYGHTAVVYGEKIFLWGGRNDERACNELFCFDTITHTWTCPKVTGQIPGARDGHSAVVIGNHMYIFGGYEEDVEMFSHDVYALNLCTFSWQFLHVKNDPPSYRDFHSATAIGHRMYIFGGRGDVLGPYHSEDEVYCNQLHYLDVSTLTWHQVEVSEPIPSGRRSHSAFAHERNLYIFGGYNGIDDVHFDEIWCYHVESNQWNLVKPIGIGPCPRRRQSCCVVDSRVFLFGGTSPDPNPLRHFHRSRRLVTSMREPKLMDHNDLFVLDFAPSLKTLCILKVIECGYDTRQLPRNIQFEIKAMTTNNTITKNRYNAG